MKKIHINPQSKGSLGKSFETECRVAYLDKIGVPWYGFDLDDRHATFYNRHPDKVEMVSLETEPKNAILRMMKSVMKRPEGVVVIDCRAQADEIIRMSFNSLSIFEYARLNEAEFVVSVFPSDDNKSLKNLGDIVLWGAQDAQFVIVNNPKCSMAQIFNQSNMRKSLVAELGAVELFIPEMTRDSLLELERKEREVGRAMSFLEAESRTDIDAIYRLEYGIFLSDMRSQYSKIASVLLPDSEMDKVIVANSPKKAKERKPLNVTL